MQHPDNGSFLPLVNLDISTESGPNHASEEYVFRRTRRLVRARHDEDTNRGGMADPSAEANNACAINLAMANSCFPSSPPAVINSRRRFTRPYLTALYNASRKAIPLPNRLYPSFVDQNP